MCFVLEAFLPFALKHCVQKETGLSAVFLNDCLEKYGENGRVTTENSIVETDNEHPERKEQLHDLSRATIANESY